MTISGCGNLNISEQIISNEKAIAKNDQRIMECVALFHDVIEQANNQQADIEEQSDVITDLQRRFTHIDSNKQNLKKTFAILLIGILILVGITLNLKAIFIGIPVCLLLILGIALFERYKCLQDEA